MEQIKSILIGWVETEPFVISGIRTSLMHLRKTEIGIRVKFWSVLQILITSLKRSRKMLLMRFMKNRLMMRRLSSDTVDN